MGFGDLNTDAGVKALNDFLLDKSYIEGYQPSQGDTVVFGGLKGCPNEKYVNAVRWYKHITSYGAEKTSFSGTKKTLADYGGEQAADDEDDEDFELFGSDDEEDDAAAAKLKEERIAAYTAKKEKKPTLVAKSSIILDVKPWDDETDMKLMEDKVRAISTDGLLWGASKLIPLAYGIKKLQIICTVEDDKVGTDFLEDEICGIEDLVQSMDVVAFNKV